MIAEDHFIRIHDNRIYKYDSGFKLLESIEPVTEKYQSRFVDQNDDIIAIVYNDPEKRYEHCLVIIKTDLSIVYKKDFGTSTHISHVKLLKDRLYMALTSGSLSVKLFDKSYCENVHFETHPLGVKFVKYQNQPYVILFNRTLDTPDKPRSMHLLPDLTEIKVPFKITGYLSDGSNVQSLGLTNKICVQFTQNNYELLVIISENDSHVVDLKILDTPIDYCYDAFTDTLIVAEIKYEKYNLHFLIEKENTWMGIKTETYDYNYDGEYPWISINCTYNHIIIRYMNTIDIIDKFTFKKIKQIFGYGHLFSNNARLRSLPQLLLDDPSLSKLSKSLISLILSFLEI